MFSLNYNNKKLTRSYACYRYFQFFQNAQYLSLDLIVLAWLRCYVFYRRRVAVGSTAPISVDCQKTEVAISIKQSCTTNINEFFIAGKNLVAKLTWWLITYLITLDEECYTHAN